MEISTPYYSHVKNYDSVYEPSEDTFLLLDALQEQQSEIRKALPCVVLEVGCGSGLVTAFLFKVIGHSASYICTDKNIDAIRCCLETAEKNNFTVGSVATDLVSALLPRLEKTVDLMVFNPPYVVTDPIEIEQNGLASAWAGGYQGRQVMDRLFPLIPKLLSPKGMFFLVVVEENKPNEIKRLFSCYGLESSTVLSRRSGPEFLSVIKFWPKT